MCMYLEIITKSTYMYIDYCCSKGIAHAHAMTICIDVTSPWGQFHLPVAGPSCVMILTPTRRWDLMSRNKTQDPLGETWMQESTCVLY